MARGGRSVDNRLNPDLALGINLRTMLIAEFHLSVQCQNVKFSHVNIHIYSKVFILGPLKKIKSKLGNF